MGKYDFGEEHLAFLFRHWKIDEGKKEADKGYKELKQFEAKMNKFMADFEKWMEG